MKENYVYPARVEKKGKVYKIEFLDFPEILPVEEDSKDKAIYSAQKYLALTIIDYESRNQKLPIPTENEESNIYIHIWMPYFRNATKEVYVKKNVTIPQWLDILAKESNINYSAALVRGIKQELGIEN